MGGMGSGRKRKEDFWAGSITIHASIPEDMNAVLLKVAKRKGLKAKYHAIKHLIATHPEYKELYHEMEEDGFFI